jgi:phosphocarrier protein HPr
MLAASKGSVVTLEAQGQDADAAIQALVNLIQDRFGEAE